MILLVLVIGSVYLLMSSAGFEGMVRQRLITELQQAIGGRVEIASFHWNLLRLEAEADGLVIHGRELQSETPLGQIARLRARVSLLGLWSPSVRLSELDIAHPRVSLDRLSGWIDKPAATEPSPGIRISVRSTPSLISRPVIYHWSRVILNSRTALRPSMPRIGTRRSICRRTMCRFNCATSPAPSNRLKRYRIEAAAADLNLTRVVKSDQLRQMPKPVHGYFQATLDLTRTSATLQSMRLTARDTAKTSHSLNLSGALQDFTNPRWEAKVFGDLDMRLLDPITGYPFAPEGLAHIDLNAAGQGGEFSSDGKIHVDGGTYDGPGVSTRGVRLDANVHADKQRLLISSIVARLRQGGQVEGTVDLSPWLASPIQTTANVSTVPRAKGRNRRSEAPITPSTLPMNGKVNALFKEVSLDTILEMVSEPPFQRIGIGSTINGQATATWADGENSSVKVAANLNLRPASHLLAGEVAGSGVVDATYTQRNGAVEVRKLELHLPESNLTARGALGAYPLSSASALIVDFHTANLGEFDTLLRSLGVQRNGKSGAAALPVSLGGQADFHGSWAGSIVNPLLTGNLTATQLDLEMPALAADAGTSPVQTNTIHLDSVEANGSYSATRITVDHGVMQRGDTKLAISGALTAAQALAPMGKVVSGASQTNRLRASGAPAFDKNAVVNLRLDAAKINADELQPFIKQKLPFTGMLDAQVQLDGTLSSPVGSGWAQLDSGSVYGEPVNRIRAQGKMANKVISLSSISIAGSAGAIAGTGSYDMQSKRFEMDAKSADIDVAKIHAVSRQNWGATGRLSFSVHGTGTFDDPQLQGDATIPNLALGGEPAGALQMNAHTVNHALVYEVTARLDTASVNLHGQTTLKPDYQTHGAHRVFAVQY